MGKERYLTALRNEQPDMVPIWDLGINEPSIINIARHFTDDLPEEKMVHEMSPDELMKMLQTLMLVVDELDFDGVTLPMFLGREVVGENLVKDRLGVVSQVSAHGEPVVVEGPIKSKDDLKKYRPPAPDPSSYIGLQLAKAHIQDKKALVFQLSGTFKFSWALRGGMQVLFMDYFDDPPFVHELANIVTDFLIAAFEGGVDAGADAVILDGDLAMLNTTLMSPGQYREFIKPYHEKIIRAVHDKGSLIVKHSDGNLWPIMDDLIEIGIDGIHPIQPQSMDIAEVKSRIGDKVCLLGNIDCQDLLCDDTPEKVEEVVKETIRAAAPGGGYILSSSNTIHPDVKPENAIAMFRAARKYGAYPIDLP